MSYVPTGASDIVKQPQFTEEETEGTLPLDGPHFVSCGFVESLGEDIAEDANEVRALGTFDIGKKIRLGETITSSITFQPSDWQLMKYGIDKPVSPAATPADPTMAAPNGTNGVSISILFSAKIDGVEKYKIYKGLRFNGCSGTIERASGFKVSMPFQCKEVTDWVVEPTWAPAATYASAPSLTPWSGITSGPDPLTINSVPYDTTSFKFDVAWTIARPSFNGLTTYKVSKAMKRTCKGSFDTVCIGGALVGDLRGYTLRDIIYKVYEGTPDKIMTFNDCQFDSYSKAVSGDSDEVWMESFTFSSTGTDGLVLT